MIDLICEGCLHVGQSEALISIQRAQHNAQGTSAQIKLQPQEREFAYSITIASAITPAAIRNF